METKIRSFIAVELNPEILKRIEEFSRPFLTNSSSSFRWVKTENMHITLKFLGDVPFSEVEKISQILEKVSQDTCPFSLSISGTGAFPSWNHPKTIWIGIKPHPELESLFKKIDMETAQMGFPSENRRFSPHLTLCRVADDAAVTSIFNLVNQLQKFQSYDFGQSHIDQVVMFKSILQHGGPIYSPLSIHSLRRMC